MSQSARSESPSQRRGKCLLLDLDGTLADTAPDMAAALNRVLVREMRLPLTFAEIRPLVSDGSWALLRAGFGIEQGHHDADRLRGAILDTYLERVCDFTVLFPGFDSLLSELEANGLPWGVMTNKPSRYTRPLATALGIDTRACAIVSADDVARSKPAPDGLLACALAAGIDPGECIYVGDADRDMTAARAAGMQAIGALWGYIKADDDPQDWGADALISHPHDLRHWLDLPIAST